MISLKGKTILVVDDEKGYREVLSDEFRMVDATVIAAENGTKAFEIAQFQKIDAIVSDVRMAGGTGVDLLDQIKALNPDTPVVMLITGYSDLSAEDAYDRGAEAIFSKPCNLDLLVEAVYRAILPERDRWVHQLEYLPSDFTVELEAASLGGAITARILSLGRGGMFVVLDGTPPAMGTRVGFQMSPPHSHQQSFEGIGICRWSRMNSESGLPSGMGVEFCSLTDESLDALSEILKILRPKAFIPKKI